MRKTSVRNIVHLIIICIPILLLLTACIFPNKKIENNYNNVETTSVEGSTAINFNQYARRINTNNYRVVSDVPNITISDNLIHLGAVGQVDEILKFNLTIGHKALVCYSIDYNLNGTFRVYNYLGYTYRIYDTSGDYGYIFNVSNNNETINFQVQIIESGYVNVSNFMLFDLTEMGLEDITYEDFKCLFPLNYYTYNEGQEITLSSLTINNTISNSSNIINSQETKQINTNIIKPINDFYNLSINDWYRDIFSYLNIEMNNEEIVKTYLLYQPLWLMWFFILEIVEIVLTAVPKLLILICKKIGGEEV